MQVGNKGCNHRRPEGSTSLVLWRSTLALAVDIRTSEANQSSRNFLTFVRGVFTAHNLLELNGHHLLAVERQGIERHGSNEISKIWSSYASGNFNSETR